MPAPPCTTGCDDDGTSRDDGGKDDLYIDDNMQKYEADVFIVVLMGMFVCCCCSCAMKKLQAILPEPSDGQQRRLLITDAGSNRRGEMSRDEIFRNSLMSTGEEDWDCALCSFGNRPRTFACNLCGTDRDTMVFNYSQVLSKIEI